MGREKGMLREEMGYVMQLPGGEVESKPSCIINTVDRI